MNGTAAFADKWPLGGKQFRRVQMENAPARSWGATEGVAMNGVMALLFAMAEEAVTAAAISSALLPSTIGILIQRKLVL
jgi:hypothetical protein